MLERLLRSLEEPWDLSASPLYRHLPTKEAAREVQQIMLQYLLEELERDPESAFLRETPDTRRCWSGFTGQKYR